MVPSIPIRRSPLVPGTVENPPDHPHKIHPDIRKLIINLRAQSKNFELLHNRNHRHSCLKGKTHFQFIQDQGYSPILPPPPFKLPEIDHIPNGTISLIRFIRSDRKLNIFGEYFDLPKELIYTYVRAKIITCLHQIQVYLGDELVTSLPYHLPAWITPDS
jgi:putative transposase